MQNMVVIDIDQGAVRSHLDDAGALRLPSSEEYILHSALRKLCLQAKQQPVTSAVGSDDIDDIDHRQVSAPPSAAKVPSSRESKSTTTSKPATGLKAGARPAINSKHAASLQTTSTPSALPVKRPALQQASVGSSASTPVTTVTANSSSNRLESMEFVDASSFFSTSPPTANQPPHPKVSSQSAVLPTSHRRSNSKPGKDGKATLIVPQGRLHHIQTSSTPQSASAAAGPVAGRRTDPNSSANMTPATPAVNPTTSDRRQSLGAASSIKSKADRLSIGSDTSSDAAGDDRADTAGTQRLDPEARARLEREFTFGVRMAFLHVLCRLVCNYRKFVFFLGEGHDAVPVFNAEAYLAARRQDVTSAPKVRFLSQILSSQLFAW